MPAEHLSLLQIVGRLILNAAVVADWMTPATYQLFPTSTFGIITDDAAELGLGEHQACLGKAVKKAATRRPSPLQLQLQFSTESGNASSKANTRLAPFHQLALVCASVSILTRLPVVGA